MFYLLRGTENIFVQFYSFASFKLSLLFSKKNFENCAASQMDLNKRYITKEKVYYWHFVLMCNAELIIFFSYFL